MKKKSSIIFIAIFVIIYAGFFIYKIIKPQQDYSSSERRVLKKFPKPNSDDLISGKYMDNFDSYTLDQFPLRDSFRSIKAFCSKYIFFQKDNNGLYQKNNHLSKLEYPLATEKMDKSIERLKKVYVDLISNTNCKNYFSIIPDKNYFLAGDDFLSLDYEKVFDNLKNKIDFANYIDIKNLLSLEDFYTTDQHWRQEKIIDIAQTLTENMETSFVNKFSINTLDNPFYGTYVGQSALKVKPDTIEYLSNSIIENCKVTSYNTGVAKISKMYDMEKAKGRDPYEMFLCGSDAFLVIENPYCENNKELVIFRDSFGSSIAPLIAPSYSKITLIDLRYIQSNLINKFIEFKNQDVLFLYSTLILNSGSF